MSIHTVLLEYQHFLPTTVMALLQTVQLEHLPPSHSIHIALYRNIQNAAFLQQQLLDGNTDFEYALIDASVIVSKIHALAAVYRAVNDLLSNRLRSRNVHSEIVFSLSPNNNVCTTIPPSPVFRGLRLPLPLANH